MYILPQRQRYALMRPTLPFPPSRITLGALKNRTKNQCLFYSLFLQFWCQKGSQNEHQNGPKPAGKSMLFFYRVLDQFLETFGSSNGAFWEHFSAKNRCCIKSRNHEQILALPVDSKGRALQKSSIFDQKSSFLLT